MEGNSLMTIKKLKFDFESYNIQIETENRNIEKKRKKYVRLPIFLEEEKTNKEPIKLKEGSPHDMYSSLKNVKKVKNKRKSLSPVLEKINNKLNKNKKEEKKEEETKNDNTLVPIQTTPSIRPIKKKKKSKKHKEKNLILPKLEQDNHKINTEVKKEIKKQISNKEKNVDRRREPSLLFKRKELSPSPLRVKEIVIPKIVVRTKSSNNIRNVTLNKQKYLTVNSI